jgi:predicted transcriptional regulator YdeE
LSLGGSNFTSLKIKIKIKMENQERKTFYVIGIEVRTTNENNKGATDIPALWSRFISEQILEKIPNKIDLSIYCMYTDYEKDYTKPYTTVLGCKVSSLDIIPVGMVGKIVGANNFKKFIAKGNLNQGVVYKKWIEIWNTNMSRTYKTDFEVYGERSQNPENAEVDIFVGIE